MTIVVLLILAVLWGVVLVPPMLRARSEARPADSIGNFRHQLSVLRRTGPTVVPPAHPLRLSGFAAAAPAPTYRMARSYSPAAARRARTMRRRRDVLFTLVAAMALTLLLGLLPPFRAVLWLHVACDLALAAYVAMLVKMRNQAAEREMKLRFLPTSQPDNVLLLRRSAN
ncbi:MAG: hypothetical protein ACRD03_15540 [Acidimicrobiales bacterium]